MKASKTLFPAVAMRLGVEFILDNLAEEDRPQNKQDLDGVTGAIERVWEEDNANLACDVEIDRAQVQDRVTKLAVKFLECNSDEDDNALAEKVADRLNREMGYVK